MKLGKSCNHIHNKYKHIRKSLQEKGKLKKLKSIKQREKHIIKDINHKITTALVKYAQQVKGGIVLEDLKQIRQTAKTRRKQRYSLNSWSYYQQQMMLEYKAKKFGVKGFVKNLPDKRVEAIIEGEQENVQKLIRSCKRGPMLAKVKDVEIIQENYTGEFNKFSILY